MTASLFSGKIENLRVAVQDKIHQPYRFGLIEHCGEVFQLGGELGSLGTYISGAGPTIIAMIPAQSADGFAQRALGRMEERGIPGWKVEIRSANDSGAEIISE
jgi:homoserine kinase